MLPEEDTDTTTRGEEYYAERTTSLIEEERAYT